MDLQYFKENVSIIQLVETLGYTYNRRKGRNPLQYEHPNGDKVIISDKLNPSMEVYFTRNKYDDKGTVVDFVKNRLPMFNVHYTSEWEGVMKVLSEFSGQGYHEPKIKTQTIKKPDEPQSPFQINDFELTNPSIKDLGYLQYDRQLSRDALKVFMPFIKLVREKGRRYQNIGFTYRIPGEDKVAGFELVNHQFKGHARGSQRRDSVWVADLSSAKQLIDHLYIGESAIDAMSFYQLYQHKFNFDHSVYISTGGNVLKSQVQNIIIAYPMAKIHTIFDNDFSGKMYDVFLAGIKANREMSIRKHQDSIQFELKKGTFEIPMDQITLAKFERVTWIRSGVRAHKSTGKDFNEMLQNKVGEKERLQATKTFKR